jgi:glycosyltransferase involved in cell wall biosynthesis
MRVLLLAGVDLSLPGGVETHVRELASHLAARGHAVEILGKPDRLEPFTMVSRIDPDRYDVFHHHAGPWPAGLDVGDRYVRTLHFCVAEKMATYVRIGRLRTLVHPLNYLAVWRERADARRRGRFIAVSERLAGEFARWHGLDRARTRVIPNGAGACAPLESRDALRRRHGIPDQAPLLLSIGRADFVKGFGLLERAWRSAPAGTYWVTVGGSGATRDGNRIATGPVPHADVASWIGAADIGAFPSHYEGGGVALLEMVAGGLYVLAHDVGVVAEVLGDPDVGRVVRPTPDAWRDAIASTLRERPLARRGPGLPARFGWGSIAAEVESVYRSAMEGGSR